VLLERLQANGIRPEDIDRVVLTHAHWDHCHNVDCFPNAEVVLHENEREYIQAPHPQDWATPIWTQDVLARSRIATSGSSSAVSQSSASRCSATACVRPSPASA